MLHTPCPADPRFVPRRRAFVTRPPRPSVYLLTYARYLVTHLRLPVTLLRYATHYVHITTHFTVYVAFLFTFVWPRVTTTDDVDYGYHMPAFTARLHLPAVPTHVPTFRSIAPATLPAAHMPTLHTFGYAVCVLLLLPALDFMPVLRACSPSPCVTGLPCPVLVITHGGIHVALRLRFVPVGLHIARLLLLHRLRGYVGYHARFYTVGAVVLHALRCTVPGRYAFLAPTHFAYPVYLCLHTPHVAFAFAGLLRCCYVRTLHWFVRRSPVLVPSSGGVDSPPTTCGGRVGCPITFGIITLLGLVYITFVDLPYYRTYILLCLHILFCGCYRLRVTHVYPFLFPTGCYRVGVLHTRGWLYTTLPTHTVAARVYIWFTLHVQVLTFPTPLLPAVYTLPFWLPTQLVTVTVLHARYLHYVTYLRCRVYPTVYLTRFTHGCAPPRILFAVCNPRIYLRYYRLLVVAGYAYVLTLTFGPHCVVTTVALRLRLLP